MGILIDHLGNQTTQKKAAYVINVLNLKEKFMITEWNLYDLGYQIKTRLTDLSRSTDFIHKDFDNRPYLVNLADGEIHIVHPTNLPPKNFFRTSNLAEFRKWHDSYNR